MRSKKSNYKFGIAQEIKVIHNHMAASNKVGNINRKNGFAKMKTHILSSIDNNEIKLFVFF
ncbi:MAG: hypothetical protein ABIJ83_03470 [Patescibacteria group bacterium]